MSDYLGALWAPPLRNQGFARLSAGGNRIRTIGPALVKGLSAVADERCRTDKLDGVINQQVVSRDDDGRPAAPRGAKADGMCHSPRPNSSTWGPSRSPKRSVSRPSASGGISLHRERSTGAMIRSPAGLIPARRRKHVKRWQCCDDRTATGYSFPARCGIPVRHGDCRGGVGQGSGDGVNNPERTPGGTTLGPVAFCSRSRPRFWTAHDKPFRRLDPCPRHT